MRKSNSNQPVPAANDNRSVAPGLPSGPKADPGEPSLGERVRELHRWCDENNVDEQTMARAMSLDVHAKMMNLFGEIDRAFGGQTLIRTLPPDDPINVHRFKTHMFYLERAISMLEVVEHLARLVSTDNGEPKRGS